MDIILEGACNEKKGDTNFVVTNEKDENIFGVTIIGDGLLDIIRLKDEETAKTYQLGYEAEIEGDKSLSLKRIGQDIYVGKAEMLWHINPDRVEKYLIKASRDENIYRENKDITDKNNEIKGVEAFNLKVKQGIDYITEFNKYIENNKFKEADTIYKRISKLDSVSYTEKEVYDFVSAINKSYEVQYTSGKFIKIIDLKDAEKARWFEEKIVAPAKDKLKEFMIYYLNYTWKSELKYASPLSVLHDQIKFDKVFNELIKEDLDAMILEKLDDLYSDIEIKTEGNFLIVSFVNKSYEKAFKRIMSGEFDKSLEVLRGTRFSGAKYDAWTHDDTTLPYDLKYYTRMRKIKFDNGPGKELYIFRARIDEETIQAPLNKTLKIKTAFETWVEGKPEFKSYISEDNLFFVAGDEVLVNAYKDQKRIVQYKISYDLNGKTIDDLGSFEDDLGLFGKLDLFFTEHDIDRQIYKITTKNNKEPSGWLILKADGTYEEIERINGQELLTAGYKEGITLKVKSWQDSVPPL